jgi:hypothetical protein
LSAHAVVGDKKVYDMTVDEKEWRANVKEEGTRQFAVKMGERCGT